MELHRAGKLLCESFLEENIMGCRNLQESGETLISVNGHIWKLNESFDN